MKAITCRRYGPPEVLQIEQVEKPSIKADEVLIRVRAAEATKSDCEFRSFKFAVHWFWLPLRLAVGVTAPRRKILGGYFSGEIVAVGAQVKALSVGDQVMGSAGLKMGGYGEYLALPARYTMTGKPKNMTFALAAAVPLGGLNALHFMTLADLKPGEQVLINGAGASIGAHAVQIAKSQGTEVTAVDSSHKEEMLRRIGADHFIDYTKENFIQRNDRYDVIFDMVAGSSYSGCVNTLKHGGRYLSANPRIATMLRSVLTTRFSDKTVRFAFARESKEELATLKRMVEDGRIGSIVDKVMPMAAAANAHRWVETERRCGAIVIDMNDPPQDIIKAESNVN